MGKGFLAPEAQAQIERRTQERRERFDGDRPLFDTRMGARTIGDMALIEPGCVIWARTDGDIANVRIAHDGEARGGLVLDVTDAPEVDTTTGAFELRRAFRCFNFYASPGDRRAFSVLTEAQVNLDAAEPIELGHVRNAYRRMAEWVGRQRNTANAHELDVVAAIARLAAIVGRLTP